MILVTGCAGFIGSAVCDHFLSRGTHVVGIDNFDPYYDVSIKHSRLARLSTARHFTFHRIDITRTHTLKRFFSSYRFTHVVHLAARPGVSRSLKEPEMYARINILGTLSLLSCIKETPQTFFLFASSSSVYGGTSRVPYTEHDVFPAQISPYGASKRAAEMYCFLFRTLYHIRLSLLRFFTVYGPDVRPDMAMYRFLHAIDAGRPCVLYDAGDMMRDYTYISDVVRAVDLTVQKQPDGEIINIGSGHPLLMNTVVDTLSRHIGKPASILSRPAPIGEMKKTWADRTHASRVLGWVPEVSFAQGVEEMVSWYKRLKQGVDKR